jgi:hypothetical protein
MNSFSAERLPSRPLTHMINLEKKHIWIIGLVAAFLLLVAMFWLGFTFGKYTAMKQLQEMIKTQFTVNLGQ